jgi:hypothetical protein
MKGLYVGVPSAEDSIRDIAGKLGVRFEISHATHSGLDLLVAHGREEWPSGPFFRDEKTNSFAAASGWFLFRDALSDLRGLATAFLEAVGTGRELEVLREIEGGAFIVLMMKGRDAFIVTDHLGLHPHYAVRGEAPSRFAPAPLFIKEERSVDPRLGRILRVNNHLFGNLTAYEGVERLEPGSLITAKETRRYAVYEGEAGDIPDILAALRKLNERFAHRPRLLPISGGLDSRLLLANGDFDYGYTFGPAKTGDRPIARRYAKRFRSYSEFSLLDLDYPRPCLQALLSIFDGICPRPFCELGPVYKRLLEAWGPAVFFDGFIGDVLNRGTYFTYRGLRGAAAKLFPPLALHRFKAERFLRRKYAVLEPEDAEFAATVLSEAMSDFDMDEPHRFLLFDILYGRAAHHALVGGTIISGQYFTPVQPFVHPPVFRMLFANEAAKTLTLEFSRRIWSQVPGEFSSGRTSSGYVPTWNHHVGRMVMLATKGLAKLGLHSRSVSYVSELSRVLWR